MISNSFKILKFKFQIKKVLSILLIILTLFTSIKYLFIRPSDVFADSTLGFNEGYGTTVSDNNSNVTGTITNAVWKQEDLCKVGKCLYFDGTGDYVSFADNANLDFGASNSFTLEGWFRTPDITSGQRTIIAKHNATAGGYKVYMDSSGYLIFGIDDDSTWTPDDSVTTSTTAFDDNRWHFFSGVKTETSISIYVDGKLYQTDSSLAATGTLANANSFYVGIDGNGSSNGFSGFLDEIKIVKSAKSVSEVIAGYTGGSNTISGTAPVGWWKLDENTGTTANDSSGNDNTGTLTNGPTWNTGKFNSSTLFDGTDDVVSISRQSSLQNITNNGSISAWINYTAVDTSLRTIFDLSSSGTSGIIFFSNDTSGLLNFQYGTGASTVNLVSSFSPSINTWYFVTATWDSSGGKLYINGSLNNSSTTTPSISVGAGTSYIGSQGAFPTRSHKGTIDDLRVYNYTRTQSQIMEDMQGYPPAGVAASFSPDQSHLSDGLVGYWKMDDTSGSTTSDYSGNNNTMTSNYAAEATGGTITHSGTNTIHTFTGSGTFTPSIGMTVNYLVVGGGGGGSEGGGGAGGLQSGSLAVTAQAYSITVGNGGSGAAGDTTDGVNGGDSIFSSVTAFGGGGGGKIASVGLNGASGGGAGSDSNLAAGGTASQGFNGGTDGNFNGLFPAGGGGGSGGIGGNASSTTLGGHGGAGTASSISGSSVTYAGGGGGGVYSVGGTGGTGFGGGGNGGVKLVPGVAGTANTGGGGGGGGQNGSGGNGGSGVVIISYTTPIASTAAVGKFGYGYSFDGTTQYASTASTVNNVQTVSFWTYPGNTTNNFANLITGTAYIKSSSGTVTGTGFTSSTVYVNGVLNGTVSANTWNHVVVTSTAGITANAFEIGRANGSYLTNGSKMDDVRLYNRVLPPTEISQLYNFATGPVGYWKFDENTGTTANDSSGNGNSTTNEIGGSSPAVPLWTTGEFGSALKFDGLGNRTKKSGDPTQLRPANDITVEAWVNLKTLPTTAGHNMYIATKTHSVSPWESWYLAAVNSGGVNQFYFGWHNAAGTEYHASTATATITLATNTWYHVVGIRNGATMDLYVNGVDKTSGTSLPTSSDTIYVSNSSYYIGSDGSTSAVDGVIDNVAVYDYARTPAQIIEDMNSHPAPGSPIGSSVAKWKFDEGYSTTAHDGSVNANDLTLSTASWTNSGKFGKAFNGLTNVRLSRTDDADLDFAASDDATFSVWFKSDSATNPSANEYILEKGGNITTDAIGYAIYTSAASDGLICFGIDDDATSFPEDSVCSTNDLYDNTWHHIVAKKTGTSRLDLYVDGTANGTPDTSISATGTLENAATFYIGDTNGTDGTDEFLGDIDEVQVFRSALAEDQIRSLFNAGASASMGSLSTDSTNNASNSDNDSYCPPGQGSTCTPPVGEWKFDENSGTSAFDSSTTNNTGTLTNGPTWASGKLGSSIKFDGTDDYVDVGDAFYSDTLTIEAWVNLTAVDASQDKNIVLKRNGSGANSGTNEYLFAVTSARKIYWQTYDVVDSGVAIASNQALNLNQWYHVAVVHGGNGSVAKLYINGVLDSTSASVTTTINNTTSRLQFGVRSADNNARYFNGLIDGIKIYNYARTPAQLAWDINKGAPIGWWKLDENTGTTANDSAGNSTAGTLTNTPTWATGKFNSGVTFAGSNQQILIADDADFDFDDDESMSVTGWFKHTTASAQEIILSKYAAAGYKVISESDGDITCGLDYDSTWTPTDSATSTLATYDDNAWHHFACVKNGATSLSLYIDGVLITTDSSITATNTLTNADPVYLGIDADGTSNDYTGTLDDIRIYRYPLTAQQIKAIMNNSAAVKY